MFENPCGERVWCVFIHHGNYTLDNNWAVIVNVVRKMDRTAAYFHTIVEYRFVDMVAIESFAAESGDKGGVNIHDAPKKIIRDLKELQKTTQTDKVDMRFPTKSENSLAEFFS